MSIVQSPAGMIIPALAVAESAKTAPAAVFLLK
jgi:phosphoribosylcarboxyaminoimidazole (NCAIR) mutase